MIDELTAQSQLTVSSKDEQTEENVLIRQVLPSPNVRLIHLEIKKKSIPRMQSELRKNSRDRLTEFLSNLRMSVLVTATETCIC